MKYFVIFLVLVSFFVLAPQAFGWCTSIPCNGSSVPSEKTSLRFIDFSYAHIIGEPIQFILEKTRDSNCNSYNAKIIDDDGNFVWSGGADISCDTTSVLSSASVQTKIGYHENSPIIINESGKYYLEVTFTDVFTKQEFVVRQNHSGIFLDRTIYPIPNPDPLDLWNSADVIIDGTVIEVKYTDSDKDNNIPNYHIKVNKYLKGVHEIGLVFAQNDLRVSGFDINDNGLFYLKAGDMTGYSIQAHSVKTFGDCSARDLIEISPILPNEEYPRSTPTQSESYFDPCVADYFTYDPDFFHGILNGISLLKQTKYGIPNDVIRCYDDLLKITKHDGSPACVKPESIPKLIERGWIDSFEAVTYNCFEAKPMEQNWYFGPSYFDNSTHHIDVQTCEWITYSEEYLNLPLCDSNSEQNFSKCRELP